MILLKCLKYDDLNKKFNSSGLGKTKYDILNSYFKGLGYTGTMADQEDQFLTANGQAKSVGTLPDRWNKYLVAQGYSGRLSDMLRTWARA